MAYNPKALRDKWQKIWKDEETYKVELDTSKPKYYVLDMFPYPSGSGLHVGHPLGYVASDIYSRYKRLKGFNVLHPMGFDAFGLPAEQYAIETGKHPSATTAENIETYKRQLNLIGLSFDWSREVVTSDPKYYKWTQWIFTKMFNYCYCTKDDKAQSISLLIEQFEQDGNLKTAAFTDYSGKFSAEDWKGFSKKEQAEILMHYRLAYRKVSFVNWCEALGTVLANDEVINGFSERGGHPVIQKPLLQWSLRITAYAERLLNSIQHLEWSESLKAQQKNWIGKSEGASVYFEVCDEKIEVFTTRPDTIYGVTFMVLAPEHPMVNDLTTAAQKVEVEAYKKAAKSKSNVDRQASKIVSGAFTGAYATHPFTGKQIPIWISEYVLIDYGTGAIMAVPSDDDRDHAFATKFGIDIIEICDKSAHPDATKSDKLGKMINSDFMNGLEVKDAIALAIQQLEEKGIGELKVNYKLRDANFSRQRYWGEPFPIAYDKDGLAHQLPENELPLELPPMDDIKPVNGKAPLSKVENWKYKGMPLDTDTMPGNAGSSWYFLRYMDPNNPDEFCSKEALNYWQDVDLYVGGTEHAVGHLMYSRFWHKFLYDLDFVPTEEPFKKLINQGMIQGESAFQYKVLDENKYVSFNLKDQYNTIPIHVAIDMVNDQGELDLAAIKKWRPDNAQAEFVLEDGKYIVGHEVEKMSKSKYNVVNPDDVIEEYGADCFRMFEMFLGPIENHKPWQTKGIDGVAKFLRKTWNLFHDADDNFVITDDKPSEKEMKVLHTCIKKVNDDVERFSFNTCVSAFMICVNDLGDLKCNKRELLTELVKLLSPFAPHISEELWSKLGHGNSVVKDVVYPVVDEKYLTESVINYPVSINGKMRLKIDLAAGISQEDAKAEVLANEIVQKWIEGKELRKFIFVPGRIVNIVV
ncbi:MAG: leucyl-tRNA synthetase [Chitinophagales bacterium]|jgi:leucyl-tRNA synthetase